MQKLRLKQTNTRKLTAQQIELLNLLQVSNQDLAQRVEKELLENPLLVREEEQATDEDEEEIVGEEALEERYTFSGLTGRSTSVDDFIGYQAGPEPSIQASLLKELKFLLPDEEDFLIAQHLVGSLTGVGYLPYKVNILAEEISVLHNREVSAEAVERVLAQIKTLGPPGIAARDVQESLLLQLACKEPTAQIAQATTIVRDYFEDFTKKRYAKIADGLQVSDRELRELLDLVTHLRPYPISPSQGKEAEQALLPDFMVHDQAGKITVTLLEKKLPRLSVRKHYEELLPKHKQEGTRASKELVSFIQDKINRAKWFIQAIAQRKRTLLRIMTALAELQKAFFKTGDETFLIPIFLRNIAEHIKMDVSTVSRAISQKAVQAHGRVYPLKYFFSEPIECKDGKIVSSRVVKRIIADRIAMEDKTCPETDEEITFALNKAGYVLARRTVAKYRKQLGFPVARLRKELEVA